PWNLAAIEAGKPVLTEKPFARNRSEAQRVADAAQTAGVTVMEGFHYLFHPVMRRALEVAVDGTIGDMHHAEVRMAMPSPEVSDPRWSFELAGGALMDLGCYGLHIMRRLGHPSIIRAHANERSPGVDEWCDVELGFPGGATGLSANTMTAPDYSFTLRIVGTRASYSYQLEAFASHVLHGTVLPIDTADAVENMAYVDAAYRAAGLTPR